MSYRQPGPNPEPGMPVTGPMYGAPPQSPPQQPPAPRRRGWVIAAPIAILCAIGAVVIAVLAGIGTFDPAETPGAASDEVTARAQEIVGLPFIYSHQTWDADIERAGNAMTGAAKKQVETNSRALGDVVRQNKATSECTVDRLALQKLRGNSATMLAVLKLSSTTSVSSAPTTSSSFLVVDLTKDDGTWLISDLQLG